MTPGELSECAAALGRRGAAARWGEAAVSRPREAPLPALPHLASGLPMAVYVGQTRSKTLLKQLVAVGFGEMTVRGEYPPRRHPWAYDNGAFRDWKAGLPFNETAYTFDILRMSSSTRHPPPDFIILPDVVADAKQTLGQAIYWAKLIREQLWTPDRAAPSLALALQDGMSERDVGHVLPYVSTLFVGGTVAWKWATAARWASYAHAHGKRLHIGRAGTPRLAKRAREAGADSIDSAFPLWSRRHLSVFIEAIESGRISKEAIALEREVLAEYGVDDGSEQ